MTKQQIMDYLNSENESRRLLFAEAVNVKKQYVKDIVYLRGLIEFSNICQKDCYYCGIRKSNKRVERYTLSDEEIIIAARYAFDNNFGSIVLQSGEVKSQKFTDRITKLLNSIQELSSGKLRVTLSCGEQDSSTYRSWFENGACRYLLRIETTNKTLYKQLHPDNDNHSFENRVSCLENLKNLGYQVGTGVMIGFPHQKIEDIADDIIWINEMDVDMLGLGPYLLQNNTPLSQKSNLLIPEASRLDLSLKTIAILRILMKDINIAATTAMQAIDKFGREKAIKAGANVFMPNITPSKYRDNYKLYDNKPCIDDSPEDCMNCTDIRMAMVDNIIAYGEWGDSKHYLGKSLN